MLKYLTCGGRRQRVQLKSGQESRAGPFMEAKSQNGQETCTQNIQAPSLSAPTDTFPAAHRGLRQEHSKVAAGTSGLSPQLGLEGTDCFYFHWAWAHCRPQLGTSGCWAAVAVAGSWLPKLLLAALACKRIEGGQRLQ